MVSVGLKRAVAGQKIDVAGGIGRETGAAHPDGGFVSVRRDIQHAGLGQGVFIVADDPAGIGSDITMRRPGSVNHTVQQQQPAPFLVLGRIKHDVGADMVVARAGIFGGDGHGRQPVGAGGQIQRVQALKIGGRVVGHHLLMATTNIVPLGPSCRSMTGVAVMPISGVTWLQPRSSDGTSLVPSSETCQNKLVRSAS